jgi:hypothetical protein
VPVRGIAATWASYADNPGLRVHGPWVMRATACLGTPSRPVPFRPRLVCIQWWQAAWFCCCVLTVCVIMALQVHHGGLWLVPTEHWCAGVRHTPGPHLEASRWVHSPVSHPLHCHKTRCQWSRCAGTCTALPLRLQAPAFFGN